MLLKSIARESKSVTDEMVAPWTETTLPTILSHYPMEIIFNADEFGLFYQCLPNKILHLKGQNFSGGKHSKIRLTGLVVGKSHGERLQMFVIGKSVERRCFKCVKTCLGDTVLDIKVGCLKSFWKIGYMSLIENL